MEYQVRIKPSAQSQLDKLPKVYYYKVLAALSLLAKDPFIGKKMEGEYRNHYNYRVWPYRLIYEIHKKELVVLVVRVGHRQGIYN